MVHNNKPNKPFSSIALSTRDGENPIPMNDNLKLLPDELATLSCGRSMAHKDNKQIRNYIDANSPIRIWYWMFIANVLQHKP